MPGMGMAPIGAIGVAPIGAIGVAPIGMAPIGAIPPPPNAAGGAGAGAGTDDGFICPIGTVEAAAGALAALAAPPFGALMSPKLIAAHEFTRAQGSGAAGAATGAPNGCDAPKGSAAGWPDEMGAEGLARSMPPRRAMSLCWPT